jgi:membrane-associated phospholipid phosphatase
MIPISKFFDYLGYYGPNILLIFSILLLWAKNYRSYLSYYLIGYILNILLNYILKGFIQQPRPTGDQKLIEMALHNGKRFGYDIYGMPSGHSQGVFYSTAFIHLVLKNPQITFLFFLISLNTMIQRVNYQNHTILQVICGAITGIGFAYLVYYYTAKRITGILKPKKDDNGPR